MGLVLLFMEVAFVTLTEIVRALFVASLMFKPQSHHASNKVCRALSSAAVFNPAIHGPYANQHLLAVCCTADRPNAFGSLSCSCSWAKSMEVPPAVCVQHCSALQD